jgi:hypothetical protein
VPSDEFTGHLHQSGLHAQCELENLPIMRLARRTDQQVFLDGNHLELGKTAKCIEFQRTVVDMLQSRL